MGCVSSKQVRCPHCQNMPYSPAAMRSYSLPVHHPSEKMADSYHVVALTSTTLGSLKLDRHGHMDVADENQKLVEERVDVREKEAEEFMKGVQESKAWSDMINEKIPKFMSRTPERMSTGEPETIDAWELMEGLDDLIPMRPQKHSKSFSFNVIRDPVADTIGHPVCRMMENEEGRRKSIDLVIAENETSLCKPPLMQMNVIQSAVELDPLIISTLRKSFEELSPDNPFYIRPEGSSVKSTTSSDDEKPVDLTDVRTEEQPQNVVVPDYKCLSFGKDKVIVYFTSLRGVRKTYEDCLHVRVILKGLGIRVDERDMSMHSGFKEELKELLGDAFRGAALPRVFFGRKYIGGAEEIRRLNEEGKLEKVFEGCELVKDGSKCGVGIDTNKACEACGDVRFVPCETCSGSCKIYYDRDEYSDEERDEDDSDHTDEDSDSYGFQRCPDCNENGLIRCPLCCY
ncbi:unnamed protein product [Rhodiola kirilowii]